MRPHLESFFSVGSAKIWTRLAELEAKYTRRPEHKAQPEPDLTEWDWRSKSESDSGPRLSTPELLEDPAIPCYRARDEADEINVSGVRRDFIVPAQVRKWGMRFDRQSDPLSFVEAIEYRPISYNIDVDRLPRAKNEVMVGGPLAGS